MAETEPLGPGPFKTVDLFGKQVPYFLLVYGSNGECTSPKTANHLVQALADGVAKDVILYSHGWNNDWPTARKVYDDFLAQLSRMAADNPGTMPPDFNPLFVGIIWPSTALTFGDENAPDFAGLAAAKPGIAPSVTELADDFAEQFRDELGDKRVQEAVDILTADKGVSREQAARLADLIAPHLKETDSELAAASQSAPDLIALWQSDPQSQKAEQGSFTDFGAAVGVAQDVQAAGLLEYLDPRWIVRTATVLKIKSRAGVVGRGVGDVVRRMLAIPQVRLFMVGHSYGAKVIMSSLAAEVPPRPAEAALLLQPAVSALCFAADVGDGREGGFRKVLGRVRHPIFLTYSNRDIPLHNLFHLVARRAQDLGELQPLAAPSRFAALGGYGPVNCTDEECLTLLPTAPPARFQQLDGKVRLVALNGKNTIGGHGDVHVPEVIWTMAQLLAAG